MCCLVRATAWQSWEWGNGDFFPMTQQPLAGQGLLIIVASRSHSRHTTVGRTPLDEWSARRRDLYLTTQNTHNRQTSTPPAGYEPTISAGERPYTDALDCDATGIGRMAINYSRTEEAHKPAAVSVTVRTRIYITSLGNQQWGASVSPPKLWLCDFHLFPHYRYRRGQM